MVFLPSDTPKIPSKKSSAVCSNSKFMSMLANNLWHNSELFVKKEVIEDLSGMGIIRLFDPFVGAFISLNESNGVSKPTCSCTSRIPKESWE